TAKRAVQVLTVPAAGVAIQGNYIGTNAVGTAVPLADPSVPGQPVGVLTQNASGVTIGGTVAGAGNVISGHTGDGVSLNGGSNLLVAGNLIGTDKDGTAAVATATETFRAGIFEKGATNVTIGGTVAATANVISGNKGAGLILEGGSNLTIQGNYIGTKLGGHEALGNLGKGIVAAGGFRDEGAVKNATIGGTTDAARNVISGNGEMGIFLAGDCRGVNVLGNDIRVAVHGVTPVPNSDRILVDFTNQHGVFCSPELGG